MLLPYASRGSAPAEGSEGGCELPPTPSTVCDNCRSEAVGGGGRSWEVAGDRGRSRARAVGGDEMYVYSCRCGVGIVWCGYGGGVGDHVVWMWVGDRVVRGGGGGDHVVWMWWVGDRVVRGGRVSPVLREDRELDVDDGEPLLVGEPRVDPSADDPSDGSTTGSDRAPSHPSLVRWELSSHPPGSAPSEIRSHCGEGIRGGIRCSGRRGRRWQMADGRRESHMRQSHIRQTPCCSQRSHIRQRRIIRGSPTLGNTPH